MSSDSRKLGVEQLLKFTSIISCTYLPKYFAHISSVRLIYKDKHDFRNRIQLYVPVKVPFLQHSQWWITTLASWEGLGSCAIKLPYHISNPSSFGTFSRRSSNSRYLKSLCVSWCKVRHSTHDQSDDVD